MTAPHEDTRGTILGTQLHGTHEALVNMRRGTHAGDALGTLLDIMRGAMCGTLLVTQLKALPDNMLTLALATYLAPKLGNDLRRLLSRNVLDRVRYVTSCVVLRLASRSETYSVSNAMPWQHLAGT